MGGVLTDKSQVQILHQEEEASFACGTPGGLAGGEEAFLPQGALRPPVQQLAQVHRAESRREAHPVIQVIGLHKHLGKGGLSTARLPNQEDGLFCAQQRVQYKKHPLVLQRRKTRSPRHRHAQHIRKGEREPRDSIVPVAKLRSPQEEP